jgi:hypothetical protein
MRVIIKLSVFPVIQLQAPGLAADPQSAQLVFREIVDVVIRETVWRSILLKITLLTRETAK